MRGVLKHAAVAGAVIASAVGALFFAATDIDDPLDRFEVVSSVASPDGRRRALVVTYHHADSSSEWTALWLSTQQGIVGSKERLRRPPAAAWAGMETETIPIWRDGRLLLKREPAIAQRSPTEACFFNEARPLFCHDPEAIEVHK